MATAPASTETLTIDPARTDLRSSVRQPSGSRSEAGSRNRPRTSGRQRHSSRLWACICLLITGGLVACLMILLLAVPQRTPIIVINGFAPDDPSGRWSDEETHRLLCLNEGVAVVTEMTGGSRNPEGGLNGLRQVLRRQLPSVDAADRLVLAISARTVLDGQNTPCLLLTESDPLDPGTWLPFPELIRQVNEVLSDRDDAPEALPLVMLCITGAEEPSQFEIGSDPGRVATAMADWLDQQHERGEQHHIALLLDRSANQRGHISDDRNSGLFAEAIAHAFRGDADEDGDREVSLAEVESFVGSHVDRWAVRNRGTHQTPRLIAYGDRSCPVVWSLSAGGRTKYEKAVESFAPVSRTVMLSDVDPLWERWRMLVDAEIWQRDPIGMRRVTSELVRLEALIPGGRRTRDVTPRLRDVITRRLADLEQLADGENLFAVGDVGLPHLPMARRLRVIDDDASTFQAFWTDINGTPTRAGVQTAIRRYRSAAGNPDDEGIRMVELLLEAPPSSWTHPEVIVPALDLFRRVSELQVPHDPRRFVPEVRSLPAAERVRRQVLDQLLLGTTDALGQTEELLSRAKTVLERVDQEIAQQRQALAIRDRLAWRLPDLLRLRTAVDSAQRASLDDSFEQIMTGLQTLNRELADITRTDLSGPIGDLLFAESRVRQLVDAVYHDLLFGELFDAAADRRSRVLLRSTWLPKGNDRLSRSPIRQRSALRERLIGHATQRNDAAIDPLNDPDGDSSEPEHSATPILAQLTGMWSQSAEGSGGESLRSTMAELVRESDRVHRRLRSGDGIDHGADVDRLRHAIRYASGWWPKHVDDDLCRQFRRRSWQRVLLRQASASRLDALAGRSPERQPFFLRSGNAFLSAAEVLTDVDDGIRADIDMERGRLQVTDRFLKTGVSLRAIPVPIALADDPLRTSVVMRTASDQKTTVTGTATIVIRNEHGQPVTQGQPMTLPVTAAEPLNFEFASTAAPHLSQLEAFANFRGHRFVDALGLRPMGGVTAKTTRTSAGPSTVLVTGAEAEPQAVMFILDCSASMTDTIARESNTGSVRKLDAARDALRLLLDELVDRENVDVGVMLYGHRVAAGETTASGSQFQKRYVSAYPTASTLRPFEDVETILPPGRFGLEQRGEVEARLKRLLPWGETPLHLATIDAMLQLKATSNAQRRRVIVITDGRNYQFQPTVEKRRTLADVLRTASKIETEVHLIGVGLPNDQRDRARVEFRAIAEATGGSWTTRVDDADQLRRRLRSLFAVSRYTLTTHDGESMSEQSGRAVTLPTPPPQGQRWTVSHLGRRFEWTQFGNERLRLTSDRIAGKLLLADDMTDPLVGAPLENDLAGRSSTLLEVTRAELENQRLHLTVRLRDPHRERLPDRRRFLVQLTPLTDDGVPIGEPILLWESFRDPETGHARFTSEVSGFDDRVHSVRLNAWRSATDPEASSEVERLSVPELLARQSRGERLRNSATDHVAWQIRRDGNRLTLVERMSAREGDTARHLLSLSPRSAVFEATHRRDEANGVVVHSWLLDQTVTPNDLSVVRLAVDVARREAETLREPLTVRLRTPDRLRRITGLPAPLVPTRE